MRGGGVDLIDLIEMSCCKSLKVSSKKLMDNKFGRTAKVGQFKQAEKQLP